MNILQNVLKSLKLSKKCTNFKIFGIVLIEDAPDIQKFDSVSPQEIKEYTKYYDNIVSAYTRVTMKFLRYAQTRIYRIKITV